MSVSWNSWKSLGQFIVVPLAVYGVSRACGVPQEASIIVAIFIGMIVAITD